MIMNKLTETNSKAQANFNLPELFAVSECVRQQICLFLDASVYRLTVYYTI